MTTALDSQEGGDHYKNMAIQPAVFIERNNLSFLEGCVIKRVCRHRRKNGAEDILKAIHELELILELHYAVSGETENEFENCPCRECSRKMNPDE